MIGNMTADFDPIKREDLYKEFPYDRKEQEAQLKLITKELETFMIDDINKQIKWVREKYPHFDYCQATTMVACSKVSFSELHEKFLEDKGEVCNILEKTANRVANRFRRNGFKVKKKHYNCITVSW